MSATVNMKLEIDIIPVSDVDRAKQFYDHLGWRLDDDVAPMDGLRIVQFTPPGSGASITFGLGLTTASPGSAGGGLIVSDIEAAVEDARDLNVARHDPLVDADVERRRSGELLGKPTDVADTQRTCRSRESALRSCGEFEDLACVGQQHPPGRGQFNVSSISYKQRRAEALLERLDLLRERRRRDVQTFGCSGEVKLLGNGDEVAK